MENAPQGGIIVFDTGPVYVSRATRRYWTEGYMLGATWEYGIKFEMKIWWIDRTHTNNQYSWSEDAGNESGPRLSKIARGGVKSGDMKNESAARRRDQPILMPGATFVAIPFRFGAGARAFANRSRQFLNLSLLATNQELASQGIANGTPMMPLL